MYDYHNSLFFPPFARAAIARATLRQRSAPNPGVARMRRVSSTFHSCLVPLEPITTTCKTALKHRERVIRTPRDGDDRTSVSARFAALFGGDTRASAPPATSLGSRGVYQYHQPRYANRLRASYLARSRLGPAPPDPASHPFERSNRVGPTRLAKTSLSARLTSPGARSHSTRRTRDGNATRRFPGTKPRRTAPTP